jgi:hypothetical protein
MSRLPPSHSGSPAPATQQQEYEEELAFHRAMLRELLTSQGTPPEQLERATNCSFGNTQRWREQFAELRQFARTETLLRDLSLAARLQRKSPDFTLTAMLTIALGIGASSAVFSIVNGLLLRPLPVPDAHQLALRLKILRRPMGVRFSFAEHRKSRHV